MFTGKSHRDFYKYFQTQDQCKKYLFDLKWEQGFCCKRCGCNAYWKGTTSFHTRCQQCDYIESFSCNTVFHKIKIPLLVAFGITFQLVVLKKGRSSLDFSREFNVQPATVRLFRKKIHVALRSFFDMERCTSVHGRSLVMDGITLIRGNELTNGFQRINLLLRSVAEIKKKHRKWQCESTLPDVNSKAISQLVCGKFEEENPNLLIWNLKNWLTGTFHHCASKNIQGYIDESFFRLNHRNKISASWHILMKILVSVNPRQSMPGSSN